MICAARALLRTIDLEGEGFASASLEPGPEAPRFVGRRDEAREVEYGAFPEFRVGPGDAGADMAELVETGQACRPQLSGNTKARAGARAWERGRRRTASRKEI
ncbi:MAG: hypothetical protein OXI87_15345 [Albidovulum sp.]|nr:hypothetical protein [Albidovulum sp.]